MNSLPELCAARSWPATNQPTITIAAADAVAYSLSPARERLGAPIIIAAT
jgi:hypothetical protein